jgi:GNAT superfamily N-acetyltransferase
VSLNIRLALPEDAEDIRNILQASYGEYQVALGITEPPAALKESIGDILAAIGSQAVYVAVYNRMKTVGTIRVRKATNDVAYISRFAVMPGWQEDGAGSSLMDAAVEWCRAESCRAVALHTAVKMLKIARFYYGCGFYIHSVVAAPAGYRRGLFVKELGDCLDIDFSTIPF